MPSKNTIVHLNDDLKFLIACCQTEISEEDIKFIHSFIQHSKFNIQHSLALANAHGILPLVYKTLKKIVEDDSAFHNTSYITHSTLEHLLMDLKSAYSQIAHRNMLMSAELIRIMKLLEENDIEALAFKGPVLAQMAYGDITLRQFGDLDIYVHTKDIIKIAEILKKDSYDSRVKINYFSNEAFLNVNSDCQFYHKNRTILLEIHWTVFRSDFSNTMKKINLWNHPKKVYIQNYELATFKIEILLVYLCMHGSKHIWERIEWIVDVDKLIRNSNSLNWHEVYQFAYTANAKTMLELGLNLTSQLFQTPIPKEIKINITKKRIISQLIFDVLTTLDKQEYFSDTELQKNHRDFRFHLSLRDTTIDKISYISKRLFPIQSADVEIINLPRRLYFIYYLLRPFRLIYKYIQKIFTM